MSNVLRNLGIHTATLAMIICYASCGGGGADSTSAAGGATRICTVFGSPSIIQITGVMSDGQSITIRGSGFGSCGPTVILFDDFEKGTNEIPISTSIGGAQVGRWSAIQSGSPPRYSSAYSHSGSMSNRQAWEDAIGDLGTPYAQVALNSANEIYFSWWMYLPTGQDIPGTSIGSPNFKIFWFATEFVSFGNDYTSTFLTNSLPATSGDNYLACDCTSSTRVGIGYTSSTFTQGRWHRYEVYAKASTSAGSIQQWETNPYTIRSSIGSVSGQTIDYSGDVWQLLNFPGFGREDSNSQTYYDDIYVAVGSGARARVEIGNAPNYDNCSNLAILTPNSWSNTSIYVQVRQGSFSAGENAYLFVINSLGEASSGYAITIGNSY